MSQWGFYFDQSRCLGCKTCNVACKNWNELRRGDSEIHKRILENYGVRPGQTDRENSYIDPVTKETNYKEYRKYYMKENWRRVETFDSGMTLLGIDLTFKSNFDRRYLSVSCNHCEEPACEKICPMGVYTKDVATGAVLYDNQSCIGCGRCKEACPWSAPQFYDEKFASYEMYDPKRPKMTKCTMCYDRVNEGLKPACVAACWNRALDAGSMDELKDRYPSSQPYLAEFADDSVPNLGIETKPNVLFKKK